MKKASLLFSLAVSIFFVSLGYYLCFEKPEPIDIDPAIPKIVGVVCMVSFGILTLVSLKKLVSK
jgi:hypothetical protein